MPDKVTHMHQTTDISYPTLKFLSVWAAYFGISSWQEAAAMAAFVYSILLISEWLYKKVIMGIWNKINDTNY